MKYCVTGINRLTGERERISRPLARDTALRRWREATGVPARKRQFIRIRIFPFPYEPEWLEFKTEGGVELPRLRSCN